MQEVFEKIIAKLGIRAEKSEKKEMDAEYFDDSKLYKGERIAFGDAIEIVKQAVVEYNNGWIPCSERMPEVPEGIEDDECPEFNVTIKGVDQATTLKCASDGTWFDDLGYTYDVIAWQPLPAPYHQSGEHKKKTNFDMCCESMEAMAQVIDIAKIGWTKEQIMEWLQSEAEV